MLLALKIIGAAVTLAAAFYMLLTKSYPDFIKDIINPYPDSIKHSIGYFGLSVIIFALFGLNIYTKFALIIFAVASEYIQIKYGNGRSFDFGDIYYNLLGFSAACIIYLVFSYLSGSIT